jgi:hypothetical protein
VIFGEKAAGRIDCLIDAGLKPVGGIQFGAIAGGEYRGLAAALHLAAEPVASGRHGMAYPVRRKGDFFAQGKRRCVVVKPDGKQLHGTMGKI